MRKKNSITEHIYEVTKIPTENLNMKNLTKDSKK